MQKAGMQMELEDIARSANNWKTLLCKRRFFGCKSLKARGFNMVIKTQFFHTMANSHHRYNHIDKLEINEYWWKMRILITRKLWLFIPLFTLIRSDIDRLHLIPIFQFFQKRTIMLF